MPTPNSDSDQKLGPRASAPKPKGGESERKYLNRCLSDPALKEAYPDRNERFTLCRKEWDWMYHPQNYASSSFIDG